MTSTRAKTEKHDETSSVQLSTNEAAALVNSLSDPSEALVKMMSRLDGDILILGAGGKMGPSLSRMASRAIDASGVGRRVIAVSRFSNESAATGLQADGIEVIRGDLLDHEFVWSLPEAANVISLIGMKFGGAASFPEIWATNTCVVGKVAERFRNSRIVALSTGNVYALAPVEPGMGAVESEMPAPIGEYAMSALGRERVYQHFSRKHGTPLAILRLNYATELRYGVLVDLAKQVHRGETISLEMGYFNVIWQRDACEFILRGLEVTSSPPRIINVTGPERLSCRELCEQFGRIFGKPPRFHGVESPSALLSDARQSIELFGWPLMSIDDMLVRTAKWIERGGETWDKPTHFQVRDGKF
jgi:nucleoside-diphosphate-sugar epimerase